MDIEEIKKVYQVEDKKRLSLDLNDEEINMVEYLKKVTNIRTISGLLKAMIKVAYREATIQN
jgi:type III secretory pathway component EscU